MQNLLTEIKQLAQLGMENTVLSGDNFNKEVFLDIMLKTEIAINKLDEALPAKLKNYLKDDSSCRTYERLDEDLKSDMILIAYCFSNYEHTSLFPDFSQDKSFIVAAEKLGIKKNTLKNTRDWFDGHNNSHRSGWWQQPLPEDMRKFKEIYDKKDKESILAEARKVLGLAEIKEVKKDFGIALKDDRFHGHFKDKEEVEEFINIVVNESDNVANDLVKQCSIRTFNACYEAFLDKYKEPTERLVGEIIKYDTRCASNSHFSLWIRARFIQEIFRQNLVHEALNIK